MPLDDAEKAQLEEIERRLAQDDPDAARNLAGRRRDPVTVPVLAATVVFSLALTALSVLTGDVLPALLALPLVAVAVVGLRLWTTPPSPRVPEPDGPGQVDDRLV